MTGTRSKPNRCQHDAGQYICTTCYPPAPQPAEWECWTCLDEYDHPMRCEAVFPERGYVSEANPSIDHRRHEVRPVRRDK